MPRRKTTVTPEDTAPAPEATPEVTPEVTPEAPAEVVPEIGATEVQPDGAVKTYMGSGLFSLDY